MHIQARHYPLLLAAVTTLLAVGPFLLRADETLDIDLFSAETPTGWTANPAEGAYVIFDPSETISLIINYTEYQQPDLSVMAKRLAADYVVKELDSSSGFLFFEDKDYRFWRGLTPQGQSLEISVHGTHEKLPALLKSVEISAETKKKTEWAAQLQILLESLKEPEVIDWLTGATPLFADPPAPRPEAALAGEPEATVPWHGMGLNAQVPQSWSIATENGAARFSAPDQKEYLLVIPLPSLKISDFGDDFDRYQARCVEEVGQIGGVNMRAAEGTIYFDMPDLSEGEIFYTENSSFALIRQGGSLELEALHWSLLE